MFEIKSWFKKRKEEESQNWGAKRPLLFRNAQQYCESVAEELPDLVMEIELSLCEKSTSLEVDAHWHFPSGDRKKLIEDDRAKSSIKNVAQQNWKAAVNIVFKHPACQDHIKKAIRSSVSREFKEYCHSTTSVLKYATPSELSRFPTIPFTTRLRLTVLCGTVLWLGQWDHSRRKIKQLKR